MKSSSMKKDKTNYLIRSELGEMKCNENRFLGHESECHSNYCEEIDLQIMKYVCLLQQ
jgi:hypothetical protein